MILEGNLLKMRSDLQREVQYYLNLDGQQIFMNDLIGKRIKIEYQNQINCIKCGRITKTSFAQGYCYPCFISVSETEECVLRPELCKAHEGIARDMEYAEEHCLIDHIVYMALTGGIKIGVTRYHQVPTRWIDQGAWKAIKLAIAPNRYIAGNIEVALKEFYNDKTNWRLMLTHKHIGGIDLIMEKDHGIEMLHPDFQQYALDDDEITEINYPVIQYPDKVRSLGFNKTPVIEDVLTGIKGQYLIFGSGAVVNVRKHNGYLVRMSY